MLWVYPPKEEEVVEEYDQDGSHAIDFDEFCAMLESSYLDS